MSWNWKKKFFFNFFFKETGNNFKKKNWVWDKKCHNCVKKISHSLCNFLLTYPKTIFLWRGEQKEIIKSFWSFETSRPEVQYFPVHSCSLLLIYIICTLDFVFNIFLPTFCQNFLWWHILQPVIYVTMVSKNMLR